MSLKDSGLTPLAIGIGIGAVAMFLWDPKVGRRRRAVARDKGAHYLHEAEEAVSKAARDLSNRARGLVAETRRAIRKRELPHPRNPISFHQRRWTPAARLVGAVSGTGATLFAFRAGFPVGCAVGTAGALFAARALSNTPLSELIGAPEGVTPPAPKAIAH